jgi:hypothetical protein
MKTHKAKRRGFGLGMEVHTSKSGETYLLLQKGKSVHVFVEIEAKDAARDCGAEGIGTPLRLWEQVRKKSKQ